MVYLVDTNIKSLDIKGCGSAVLSANSSSLLQPPETGQYHGEYPRKTVIDVYCNSRFYPLRSDQRLPAWHLQIYLQNLPCGNVQPWQNSECGNVNYCNFIIITAPLKLSFPVVSLQISSLPNFTLKFRNKLSMRYLRNQICTLMFSNQSPFCHRFYPHLRYDFQHNNISLTATFICSVCHLITNNPNPLN